MFLISKSEKGKATTNHGNLNERFLRVSCKLNFFYQTHAKTYQLRLSSLNSSPNARCFLRASCTLNFFNQTLCKWTINGHKLLGLQIHSLSCIRICKELLFVILSILIQSNKFLVYLIIVFYSRPHARISSFIRHEYRMWRKIGKCSKRIPCLIKKYNF